MARKAKNKPTLYQLHSGLRNVHEEIASRGLNHYASFTMAAILIHFSIERADEDDNAECVEFLRQSILDISVPEARPVVVGLLDNVRDICAAIVAISKGDDSSEDKN